MMNSIQHVKWDHGSFDVHLLGGMLAGVELETAGRRIKPFYEAAWIGDGTKAEPPLLNNLRSEFPCVPFGVPYAPESVLEAWQASVGAPVDASDGPLEPIDALLHGYCSNYDWTLIERSDLGVHIAIDYPETSAIRRLTRTVTADPNAAAIDFSLTIEARAKGRRPIGLHPNLALPSIAGALRLEPGAYKFGFVHPAGPEPGVSRAVAGAVFDRIQSVPMREGGTAAFDRLPFAYDTEEILQLCGTDGRVGLEDEEQGVRYQLTWDAEVLPSLLLWISNRGRSYEPWSGRNLCLGVEPLAAAFDLGLNASLASNPINERGVPTAVALTPETPINIAYRFEASVP